jgi:hypothetical protein
MKTSCMMDRRDFLQTTLAGGVMSLAGSYFRASAATVREANSFQIVPTPKAIFSYPVGDPSILVLHSSSRYLEHGGRRGLNLTSIHGRAALPRHTVGARKGSVAFWFLPLQEISPEAHHPNFAISNPLYDAFVFLSDREAVGDAQAANFCLFQSTNWYSGLTAKFVNTDGSRWGQAIAQATANHFEFLPHNWYQIVAVWDRDKGDYRVCVNGIFSSSF